MTSNFSINHVFEANLDLNFTVNEGLFDTYGQTFIIQHATAIQNLEHLTSWSHETINEDTDNYFEIEYRWSFDTITWSTWIEMVDEFTNFLDPNITENIWIQVKYKFITDNSHSIELKELNIQGTRIIHEIFEPTTITPGHNAIYTNNDTYKVFKLEDFTIFLRDGNYDDVEVSIRYTQTQGRRWTDWIPLTAANLQSLKIERLKFCNFQFAFENVGDADVNLYDLELIGDFQNVTANYASMSRLGLKTQCNPLLTEGAPTCDAGDQAAKKTNCTPCSESLTPWNPNISDCDPNKSNYVQINDRNLWANQIKTYQQLNDFIQQTNSWKITYLLTDADEKGIDHVLHEQQIHNVISMKDMNVVVPDNQFPVDNVNFSGLDLDLIQSFEIHIMKDAFKNTFGVEFRPSKKDVIYMCDMNQLWEVEQMWPMRGFMLAETYYRVLMKKYSDRASRKFAKTEEGAIAENFIDTITKYTTLDGLFGLNVDQEIKKNTKDLLTITDAGDESQQHTQTTIINIRSIMNDRISIIDHEIWNASLKVAKNAYEIPIKSKDLRLVEYTSVDQNVGLADNRAISFWFKTQEYNPNYKWSLVNNYDETNSLGYKVDIYQGVMTLTINATIYQLPVAQMVDDTWYSVLINMNQIKKQIELAIYNRQNENGITLSNSQLVLFNKLKFDNVLPSAFTHDKNVYIGGSDTFINIGNQKKWYITNLRIWNQVIDNKVRKIVLNENVVSDAHLTIIVDNAERTLDLPEYGNF